MIETLVYIHICAGVTAVTGMIGAIFTRKGSIWHRRFGKTYVYSMAVALLISFVVSIFTQNLFLLLIGVFSGYLIYTGWRLAKIKSGLQSNTDKTVIKLMLLAGVMMLGYGGYTTAHGSSLGITLMVFGVIGLFPAWSDLKKNCTWPTGKERIILHLTRMGGGCIATITAVFVTNIQTTPALIAWLLPTVIGSLWLTYWVRRISIDRAHQESARQKSA